MNIPEMHYSAQKLQALPFFFFSHEMGNTIEV